MSKVAEKPAEKVFKNNDYLRVALGAIQVENGFNVREELEGIEDLALSIHKHGQLTPGTGHRVTGKEEFVLTAGHRRLAAIKLANEKYGGQLNPKTGKSEPITHMDFMRGASDSRTRIITMLLDGDASHSLTNEQMVVGIRRLLDDGMKKKDIFESLAINVSQAQKYNLIKAAQAPEPIQRMIAEGEMSVAVVNDLQRKNKDDESLVEAATAAVADAKSTGKAKATAKNTEAGKTKVSADVAKLEEAISLADPTSAKAATLKAIVNKLKSKASAEDIAKLLK